MQLTTSTPLQKPGRLIHQSALSQVRSHKAGDKNMNSVAEKAFCFQRCWWNSYIRCDRKKNSKKVDFFLCSYLPLHSYAILQDIKRIMNWFITESARYFSYVNPEFKILQANVSSWEHRIENSFKSKFHQYWLAGIKKLIITQKLLFEIYMYIKNLISCICSSTFANSKSLVNDNNTFISSVWKLFF